MTHNTDLESKIALMKLIVFEFDLSISNSQTVVLFSHNYLRKRLFLLDFTRKIFVIDS
jgi:hypothetical protein